MRTKNDVSEKTNPNRIRRNNMSLSCAQFDGNLHCWRVTVNEERDWWSILLVSLRRPSAHEMDGEFRVWLWSVGLISYLSFEAQPFWSATRTDYVRRIDVHSIAFRCCNVDGRFACENLFCFALQSQLNLNFRTRFESPYCSCGYLWHQIEQW